MSEIRWEDPPASDRVLSWREKLTPLVDYPKRWAVIAVKPGRVAANSLQLNLRRGRLTLPPGRWEFVYRVVEGEHRVYARYLGPDEDGAS